VEEGLLLSSEAKAAARKMMDGTKASSHSVVLVPRFERGIAGRLLERAGGASARAV
jgi:hypothetical protein